MSKPSEKAMRLVDRAREQTPYGIYGYKEDSDDIARDIDAFAAEALSEHKRVLDKALEAQHRKTWALAMDAAAAVYENGSGPNTWCYYRDARDAIELTPCPPIEAAAIAELKTNEKPLV